MLGRNSRSKEAKIVLIQNPRWQTWRPSLLENLFFTSTPVPKGQLTGGGTIHRIYGASRPSGHNSVQDSFSPGFDADRFTQV